MTSEFGWHPRNYETILLRETESSSWSLFVDPGRYLMAVVGAVGWPENSPLDLGFCRTEATDAG